MKVKMDWGGRTLLGEVVSYDADADRVTVRHFNGDPWPIRPRWMQVRLISRREVDVGDYFRLT